LRLDESPEFVDVNPRYLLTLDAAGRVIGHNRAEQRLLEAEARAVECQVGGHACEAAALVCARAVTGRDRRR
jgi:transcriptional regulator of acetoin/glycerol metabolism